MLQPAVTWFFQNFAMAIIGIAVIYAGLMFLAGRMGLLLGVGIVTGAVVVGNYQAIAAAFMGMGGSAGFG